MPLSVVGAGGGSGGPTKWRGLWFTIGVVTVPAGGASAPLVVGTVHHASNDFTPTAGQSTVTVNTPGWYRIYAAVFMSFGLHPEVGAAYHLDEGSAVYDDATVFNDVVVASVTTPLTITLQAEGYYLFSATNNILDLQAWQTGVGDQTFTGLVVAELIGTA